LIEGIDKMKIALISTYFMGRRLLSPLFSKYRTDTINSDLDKTGNLKLSIDQ